MITTATQCDKGNCSASAAVELVIRNLGVLTFCGHHAREVEAQLEAKGTNYTKGEVA
jgi:hypothetical protein